jgi:uncharacterized protein (TIRG00374 family)
VAAADDRTVGKEPAPMKRKIIVTIVAICVTVIFIAILSTQISIGDIVTTLTLIDPLFLAAGFILYIGGYLFRAIRFYYLNHAGIPVKDLYSIVALNSLMNYVLPARTGELSYVYLVKQLHDRTTAEGIATLFIARMFDVIAIAVLFILSFIAVIPLLPSDQRTIYWVIGLLVLFVAVLFIFLYQARAFYRVFSKVVRIFHLHRTRPGEVMLRKGGEIVTELEKSRSTADYSYGTIFLYSMVIWLFFYSFTYILAVSMGIQLTIPAVFFACTFAFVTGMLPIQGIGNFGTFETGWTIGFLSVGAPIDLAISTGFVFHVIGLFFSIVLVIFSLAFLNRKLLGKLRSRSP